MTRRPAQERGRTAQGGRRPRSLRPARRRERAVFPLLERDRAAVPLSPIEAFAREHDGKARFVASLERAARAARRERDQEFGRATEALFDLVAESELLPVVAPRGRVGRDFASRCLAAARRCKDVLRDEAEALGIARGILARGEAGARRRAGPTPLRTEATRNEADGQGGDKRAGRRRGARRSVLFLHAAASGIELTAASAVRLPADSGGSDMPAAEAAHGPGPAALRRLGRLARRAPGDAEEGLAPGTIALPGTAWIVDRRGRGHLRPTIPGSTIVLGPQLEAGGSAIRIARDGGGRASATAAQRRLGRALALLDAAWPEAAREVRVRTRLVLPLDERGLVSFSMASRPGVSFINLRGKTIVDLADDLLHEAAHHRLHTIESRLRLFAAHRGRPFSVTSAAFTACAASAANATAAKAAASAPPRGRGNRRADGRASSRGAAATAAGASSESSEIRYWSPWRRALRPVRGIFHSCYTFAFRAELLDRIARTAHAHAGRAGALRVVPRRGRVLLVEARRERRRIARSLLDLDDAAGRGSLTRVARRMLDRVRRAIARTSGQQPR